jgi:hypothetical protein
MKPAAKTPASIYVYIIIVLLLMLGALATGNLLALVSIPLAFFFGWHTFYVGYQARYGVKPFADVLKRRTIQETTVPKRPTE